MEEAEALCDRVAIIDYGRIIALDTPPKLISNLCADSRITFSVDGKDIDAAEFKNIAAVNRVERTNNDFILYTRDDNASLQELVRLADKHKFRIHDIHTRTPNLDDVFLTLTGREIRE
jgi:ABC-2 type transport system ATP-binding protein